MGYEVVCSSNPQSLLLPFLGHFVIFFNFNLRVELNVQICRDKFKDGKGMIRLQGVKSLLTAPAKPNQNMFQTLLQLYSCTLCR